MRQRCFGICLCTILATGLTVEGALVSVPLGAGTNPLPSVIDLGAGILVVPFGPDPAPELAFVSDVPSGGVLSGDVELTPVLQKREVPSSWPDWASGREPVVYESADVFAILDVPDDTTALAFWLEPLAAGPHTYVINVHGADGSFVQQIASIVGVNGARGFGFRGTTETTIDWIEILGEGPFAVAEFYGIYEGYSPIEPGDCDGDSDIDLTDFAEFQLCFTGSGGTVTPQCACADLDGDGDADLVDFNIFQVAFTGS